MFDSLKLRRFRFSSIQTELPNGSHYIVLPLSHRPSSARQNGIQLCRKREWLQPSSCGGTMYVVTEARRTEYRLYPGRPLTCFKKILTMNRVVVCKPYICTYVHIMTRGNQRLDSAGHGCCYSLWSEEISFHPHLGPKRPVKPEPIGDRFNFVLLGAAATLLPPAAERTRREALLARTQPLLVGQILQTANGKGHSLHASVHHACKHTHQQDEGM